MVPPGQHGAPGLRSPLHNDKLMSSVTDLAICSQPSARFLLLVELARPTPRALAHQPSTLYPRSNCREHMRCELGNVTISAKRLPQRNRSPRWWAGPSPRPLWQNPRTEEIAGSGRNRDIRGTLNTAASTANPAARRIARVAPVPPDGPASRRSTRRSG